MVRLFQVYYSKRTLVLLGVEVALVLASFLLATALCFGPGQLYSVLFSSNHGWYKLLAITVLAILCFYYFDLYDIHRALARRDEYYRLFAGLGTLSLVLAAFGFLFPTFMLGKQAYVAGLAILTFYLFFWRTVHTWLMGTPYLSERIYVLGTGPSASHVVNALRNRPGAGVQLVGWAAAAGDTPVTREALADSLIAARDTTTIDRVIVALSDRRNVMPLRELLNLRLSGVKIDNATEIEEQLTGRIEVEGLNPSWLIFSDGFRLRPAVMHTERFISLLVSLCALLVTLPLLPWVVLAIKLSSPGPVFYGQKRVGRNGQIFECYKFRTMHVNAEAATGPTWANNNDPRVTRVGRFLRRARIDEIPQLWNVLRGEMSFVGPRPERPEFVEWLSREIPYYNLRHLVPPGITGWAQVNYPYGASLEESKEKLCYDLYYVKNLSVLFDLLIIFRTMKIVLLGRGSR